MTSVSKHAESSHPHRLAFKRPLVVLTISLTGAATLLLIVVLLRNNPTEINSTAIKQKTTFECTRSERYDNPPEFERSLSLIQQRMSEATSETGMNRLAVLPCVAVMYADLSNEEAAGVFHFD
jgi:hypothetical protein